MMNELTSTKVLRFAVLFVTSVLLSGMITESVSAQRRATSARLRKRIRSTLPLRAPLPAVPPLPASVDPFAALEGEADAGRTVSINFSRTLLDSKAEATAQVALKDQMLLARVQAKNMPLPTKFGVPRYALWVYIPNYGTRMYIGDLPITPTSQSRGISDSAYRFTNLPPGGIFGGLILTAEPVRYTPVVNEPLKPMLLGLVPGVNVNLVADNPSIYAESPYLKASNNHSVKNVRMQEETKRQVSPRRSRQSTRRRTHVTLRRPGKAARSRTH